MAKRLYKIEQSLKDLYTPIKVSDLEGGSDTPVTVFVCHPDIEEVPKRVYPTIEIRLVDMEFDNDMENHSSNEQVISVINNQMTTRKQSHWYRLSYEIHSWCLYALHDRDLIRRVENRISPRDALVVDDESYWMFRENFRSLDEIYSDRMIYHKVWTYEILADIDNSETDETGRIVEEIYIRSNSIQTRADKGLLRPIKSDSTITTASQAQRSLHREYRFNDQKYWFPQT